MLVLYKCLNNFNQTALKEMFELFKKTRNIEMCNTYHLYKLYFSIHFEECIVKTIIIVVFKKNYF